MIQFPIINMPQLLGLAQIIDIDMELIMKEIWLQARA